MKKLALIWISICLLLSMAACERRIDRDDGTEWVFYYLGELDGSEGVVKSETRKLGSGGELMVLNEYFAGPESQELNSPFPIGTTFSAFDFDENQASITMSQEYSQLRGAEKTMAEACLTKTLLDLTGCDVVEITEYDGNAVSRSADAFLFDPAQETIANDEITLYFADENFQYLVAEKRSIVSGHDETDLRYVIEQLLRGPGNGDLQTAMPEGTELISAEVKNGICTVDLSSEFFENRPKTQRQELVTVYSIVNSLASIDGVSRVVIKVQGNSVDFYRYMSLSEPISPYDGIVGPVNAAMNEVPVELYIQSWSPDYLAGLPSKIKRKVNVATEEQLINALLEFKPPSGYSNPIPKGTKLNSVSYNEGICTVDLSGEFISSASIESSAQRLSVLAVAATLSQLEYIDAVQILIDGEVRSLPEFDLSEPITVTGDMFFP